MAQWRKTIFTEFISDHGPGASPIFQIGQDATRCQRVIDVSWGSLYQAALDFLGYSSVTFDGGSGTSWVSRITPHNVQMPGFTFLYCQQFTHVTGIGSPADRNYHNVAADMAQFKTARCAMSYETPDYTIRSDAEMRGIGAVDANGLPDESSLQRYVIRKSKPKARYLTLPRGSMRFVGGTVQAANAGINLQPGKIVPGSTFELTWVGVPARAVSSQFICADVNDSPINLINSANDNNSTNYLDRYLGTVNLTVFADCRIGTLLYQAVDLRPHRNPFGWRTFDVTVMMDFSPQATSDSPPTKFGHNLVPALTSASAFGWVEITADGNVNYGTYASGKNIYDYSEFRNLLKAPAQQN